MGNTTTNIYQTYIKDHSPRWLEWLQELVRIPSAFGNEGAVAKLVASYVELLGLTADKVSHNAEEYPYYGSRHDRQAIDVDRHSLTLRVPGSGGGASIILCAHMDIVPAGDPTNWTYPPFSAHVDEDANIIYGRGTMDNKAGVVIALAVLQAIIDLPLRLKGDVIFHFLIDDEVIGNGGKLCLEAGYRGDCALIIDGTRLEKAYNQHAGNLQFELRVVGKPASVSVSHMGVNSAEVLSDLSFQIRQAIFALNQDRAAPWDRFPSPYQISTLRFESIGQELTIPDQATAQFYTTFPPPHSLADMKQLLQEQVTSYAEIHSLPEVPELIWSGIATEPVSSDTTHIESLFLEVTSRLGMEAVDISPSTGISDLRHYVAEGIPCMLYGPGRGYNPHRFDEHYYLDDLPKMILFYLNVVEAWCNSEGKSGDND